MIKFHRPHIKITPLLLSGIVKSYFQLNKNKPIHQHIFLTKWLHQCKHTQFGIQYGISSIGTIDDFQKKIPIHHYDTMWPWIEQAMRGKRNIITPERIEWFATSSGTTGASKYIPVTKKSLKTNHFKAGTAGVMYYIKANPETTAFSGQNLTIGGIFTVNPYTGKRNVGFISALLQKNSPLRAKVMKQPKAKIAYLPDREPKVEKMITSTVKKNITSIAGQPSRCSQFLLKVLEKTGKKNILEVRPHFQLVMRGGMAIDLYKETFETLLPGNNIQYYQIYNASEGFFAMQHENNRDDMLLFLNHGVFYEFIPLENYLAGEYSVAYTIDTVACNKEYVMLVTTNAGLRRYVLGDTIQFTGLSPHTIKITGRTKYYIDLVGEVMGVADIEKAVLTTCKKHNIIITDFTVGPRIETTGKKCYEFIIGCKNTPKDKEHFLKDIDERLCDFWGYKDERIDTGVISEPIVHFVSQDIFYTRLAKKGKLGGQYKVPKVSNDRKIIEELLKLIA